MTRDANSPHDVIIVGAGIIGITAGLALLKRGRGVTIIDRKGVAAEASSGNAAAFAFADIEPLASPGIILQAPKWLFDPLGPLSVPPSYALKIAPWLWRFFLSASRSKVEAGTRAQANLMALSRETLADLMADTGTKRMLRWSGQLEAYESKALFERGKKAWLEKEKHGYRGQHLDDPAEIAKYQPGLGENVVAATFTRDWATISDPLDYALALSEAFVKKGGVLETGAVGSVEGDDKAVRLTLADGRALKAEHAVIACGAWSKPLAAGLGDTIPLETERGYNTTLPKTAFDLRTMLIPVGHGFVISPLDDGVRIGGAVELGGLKRKPDFRRANAMLKQAQRYMPGLVTEGGRQWMGFRPSLPDTLPVISRSKTSRRVVYGFGHGHLGLTQSSGTADLIAGLITGGALEIDINPFRADRF